MKPIVAAPKKQSNSGRNYPPNARRTPRCLHCKKQMGTLEELNRHLKVCTVLKPAKKKQTCKFGNDKFSNITFHSSFHIPLSLLQLNNTTKLKKMAILKKMAMMTSIILVFFVEKP